MHEFAHHMKRYFLSIDLSFSACYQPNCIDLVFEIKQFFPNHSVNRSKKMLSTLLYWGRTTYPSTQFSGLYIVLTCFQRIRMIDVTVLAMIERESKPGIPLVRLMNERLVGLARDLQTYLLKEFKSDKQREDLIIYLSYNSKYTVRWKIVNDVPEDVQEKANRICGNLGYIPWLAFDLYTFKATP